MVAPQDPCPICRADLLVKGRCPTCSYEVEGMRMGRGRGGIPTDVSMGRIVAAPCGECGQGYDIYPPPPGMPWVCMYCGNLRRGAGGYAVSDIDLGPDVPPSRTPKSPPPSEGGAFDLPPLPARGDKGSYDTEQQKAFRARVLDFWGVKPSGNRFQDSDRLTVAIWKRTTKQWAQGEEHDLEMVAAYFMPPGHAANSIYGGYGSETVESRIRNYREPLDFIAGGFLRVLARGTEEDSMEMSWDLWEPLDASDFKEIDTNLKQIADGLWKCGKCEDWEAAADCVELSDDPIVIFCESCAEDARKCDHCSTYLDDDDSYTYCDQCEYTMCESCNDDHYYCDACSEAICGDTDMVSTDDGTYHEQCAIDAGWAKCEDCDNWTDSDDLLTEHQTSVMYCDECASSAGWQTCESCAEPCEDPVQRFTGDAVCCDCKSNYEECPDCDKWCDEDDPDEWDDQALKCVDCA